MCGLIAKIHAREVLDSRGNPTVEVDVETNEGVKASAIVPSGASTGIFEALELRDGGGRYHGKGVLKAVKTVKDVIAPKLIGFDVSDQAGIDGLMLKLDGTENKSNLGGNTILGVSIACAKSAAESAGLQLYEYVGADDHNVLPIPFFNIINGGKHAGNNLDFQEFMVVPVGARSFGEALRMGSEIYNTLKGQLLEAHGRNAINVGDEGGFSPPLSRPDEALEAVMKAVEEIGYQKSVSLAMDVAANSFFTINGEYAVSGKILDRGDMIELYRELVDAYPVISIEDPLEEEDYEGFANVTRELDAQILGTDDAKKCQGEEYGED